MTIDKAIDILEYQFPDLPIQPRGELGNAARLGIKALRRITECRLADHTIQEDYLPGETGANNET